MQACTTTQEVLMTFNISTNPKTVASWDTISSPQAYAQKPVAAAYVQDSYYIKQPQKSSAFAKIAKLVLGLAVVAGALAGARANISAVKNVDIQAPNSYKGFKKCNYYIAKTGQFVLDNLPKLKFWGKKAAEKTAEQGGKTA